MIYRYVIYGLLGWNLEVRWTGAGALLDGDINMIGHTSLWMFVIYGAAGVCFEKIHKFISSKRWYERGLIWMYFIFTAELISGLLLRSVGIRAWEYTGTFSLLGVIRLDYAPVWFVVGLIFERVHLLCLKIGEKII